VGAEMGGARMVPRGEGKMPVSLVVGLLAFAAGFLGTAVLIAVRMMISV
jgi:hypothetical protein